jgi:hypothetical protein
MNKALIILLLFFLTGCSSIDMQRYSNNKPELDLFNYFEGSTIGWGIVQDRKGVLLRQFVVTIDGSIDDNGQLTLMEDFDWSDGEKSSRKWILTKDDAHTFSGTASDVIDKADGTLYGNVLNWKYRLNLKVDNTTWKITFDDWMFLVSDDLLINKATMSKFGFEVGEITIVFQKQLPDSKEQS